MLVVTEVETLCYDNRESVSNVRDVRWRAGREEGGECAAFVTKFRALFAGCFVGEKIAPV